MDSHSERVRAGDVERDGDAGCNKSINPTLGDVIAARFNRRDMLRGALAVTAISATLGGRAALAQPRQALHPSTSTRSRRASTARITSPSGYDAQVLLRWGDPIFPDAPAFDPLAQSAEKQARQFGYNSDYRRLHPDRRLERARPARRQPRIHQRGADVPGRRHAGRQGCRLRQDDQGAGRHRDGGAWRLRWSRSAASRRQMARGAGHRTTTAASRPRRRWTITGPAAGDERMQDLRRSVRPKRPRHAQQLRRRRHALGHVAHLRGELQRLFLGQARRGPSRRRATTSATASARPPTRGASSTTASISPRSRTSRTASAGWSRSIPSIRRSCRGSARRSAASSTRAPPASSTRDGRYVVYLGDDERFDYVYKFVTRRQGRPAEPCRQFRPARRGHALRRQVTTPTAPAHGCRSSTARARSRRRTASAARPTC